MSWSHYRTLSKIENKQARLWYMNEAIEQNWSVRALQRQISKLYYERLLSSQINNGTSTKIEKEAKEKQKHSPFLH